jgi:PGF-pre-PGF domain-containing protein
MTGWCNPAGMMSMFDGMEMGAPAPLGTDEAGDVAQASVDLMGFGMKDMGDAYGFGGNVLDFSNASVCNKEKVSMQMFMGPGAPMAEDKIGAGNETVKFIVYLDTDGSTSGGCSLPHDSSSAGYEFRFRYSSEWNVNTSKASETFNAYKCENSQWKATDIKLSTWKQKMCSELGGPLIAVEKDEFERFPTLYDSSKDLRVFVATIGNTGNASEPSDTAGPGWTTPGAIDFEIMDVFSYEATGAKFEDILKKGFVEYEDCFNSLDDDSDGDVDCNDWDCQFAKVCEGLGVNLQNDTRAPTVTGVKIEEYKDAALIMYNTNKPTNGTLQFYYNDSQCSTLNATIYDVGIISDSVREFKLWHIGEIYNDAGLHSLTYALLNSTNYYYKLKVCDSSGKCGISKCTALKTASQTKCSYCKFVSRIKVGSTWNVYYDVDQDGTYEHWQGHMCGPNSGMKTNYTIGRSVNIKMNKTDGSVYFEFINASLTKTGLSDKVRTISDVGAMIHDTDLNTVGLNSETRDKIINNLHPEVCRIKIPFSGTCDALWHCDDNGENCIDRTSEANLVDDTNCVWEVPYCEFSTYAEAEPSTGGSSSTTPSGGSSGGGGGGGGAAPSSKYVAKGLWASMPVGTRSMKIRSSIIPFTKLEIDIKKEVTEETSITVQALNESEKPTVGELNREVQSYIKVTTEVVSNSNINSITISFKVPKEWFGENSVGYDEIALYRYTNKWIPLPTERVESDDDYVYYEAISLGFSYFAVAEKSVEEIMEDIEEAIVTTDDTIDDTIDEAPSPETEEKTINPVVYVIVAAMLAAIIIVAIVMIVSHKKKAVEK